MVSQHSWPRPQSHACQDSYSHPLRCRWGTSEICFCANSRVQVLALIRESLELDVSGPFLLLPCLSHHVSLILASTTNNEATNKPKENTPRSCSIYYSPSVSRGNPCLQSSWLAAFFPYWDPGEFHKQPQTVTQSQLVLGSRSGNRISRSSVRWSLSQERVQTPWQRSQSRRGDARRWVTEGAAEISFTPVRLQVGIQDVSKLEDVDQSKRSYLRKWLTQTGFQTTPNWHGVAKLHSLSCIYF